MVGDGPVRRRWMWASRSLQRRLSRFPACVAPSRVPGLQL